MSEKVTGIMTVDLGEPIHVTGRYNPRTREIVFDNAVEIPMGGTLELGEVSVCIDEFPPNLYGGNVMTGHAHRVIANAPTEAEQDANAPASEPRLGDYWAEGYFSEKDREEMLARREAGEPRWWDRR